ncbi:MAG: response regulator [Treponema sp.]|nr:response regulator [Treponema sp.]
MGKVLFTGNRSEANEHLNEKLQEKIDCIFVELKEQRILETAEKEKVTLIVVHLTALSSEERVELARLLHDTDKIPFILTGSRDELHKYFGRTEARILRFIRTPLLFSAFVAEIKRILTRLEEREIAESELYEIESKVIVEKEQPKHILIVDDDPVVLRTMSNVLRGLFRVSVVKTGNAAVSFLANERPDLILLDYQMPLCDGPQTLGAIRSQEAYKDIPVFFLTDVNDAAMVKDALTLNPQDYILKSAGVRHLLQKIEAFF